ncbi:MAG: efflux RND transporter periplasmic adaptor subunit [Pseudomonadota bacterium]
MTPRFYAIALVLAAAQLGACGDAQTSDASVDSAPAYVQTLAVAPAAGYESISSYSGRVEAVSDSALAFEIGGKVVELLVDEGDSVTEGEPLARLDTARLNARRAEAFAGLRRVNAELKLAEATYDRVAEAFGYKGVSQQALDEAEQQLLTLQASRDVAAAKLERIDVDIEKSTLIAAFDGTITRRHVDPGAVLAAGAAVARLQSSNDLEARIGVAPGAARSLQIGDRYELSINDTKVDATLRAVISRRDERTRTVDALFSVSDGTANARPGDTAKLVTTTWNDAQGYWLPLSSLVQGSRGLWQVLVADSDGDDGYILEGHVLEVLYADADRAFVRGTLQDGDRLVSTGTQRVVAGQAVRIDALPDSERLASVGDDNAD